MEIRSWLSPRHRQRNRLHAYIEGALEGAERAQFEAAMARDPALAREVGELRAIRLAARELPEIEAPRSFRLTAAMVAAPARQAPASRRAPVALRLAQGAAALSVFALAVTFVAGAVDNERAADTAASGESASLAAEDATTKQAPAAAGAPGGTANSSAASAATADGRPTVATPVPSPFAPTLPPYSPTSSVSGQGVTATAETPATAVASPTPRAPATGPGEAVTAMPTPVPPLTGGGDAATVPGTPSTSAYGTRDGGVTGGATITQSAPAGADKDGPGTMRLAQAGLAAVAVLAIGATIILSLRRRREP